MNLSIGTPLLKAHFNNHLNIKDNLLSLIDQSKIKLDKEKFKDVFHKLDWNKASNDLWFQQYGKEGTHGWHVHANNFTGVYYLEFDNHQYTQLLDPLDLDKAISLRVIEGDFIIFPSHVIHRSGVNKENKRRSIISFNFDVKDIREDLLKERTIKYVY